MGTLKKIEFVRFGGLSSVIQKGYDISMPNFHSPPVRRGIYAFVAGQIENFLITERRSKEKPRRFKYEGNVWHHLGWLLGDGDILEEKGSWYLTTFSNYVKALKKELGIRREEISRRGIHIAKDNLEVFIEKV